MRGIKRHQSRVVHKEHLWDMLENAHTELSHAGRDRMHNQWVSVLHNVQCSKNISHHRGINATPYSVHLGEHRPISVYTCHYPGKLETEDQLEQALGSRQVIECAFQDAQIPG